MGILDFFKWIADILQKVYLAARNRPQVTCDLHVRLFELVRCYPVYGSDEDGKNVVDGITIVLHIKFLLANNGPVDTTLKDIYVLIKHNKKELCRLHPSLGLGEEIRGNKIEARGIWGPRRVKFEGTIWGIEELPQGLKTKLIIQPVAQRPVRKKLPRYFFLYR